MSGREGWRWNQIVVKEENHGSGSLSEAFVHGRWDGWPRNPEPTRRSTPFEATQRAFDRRFVPDSLIQDEDFGALTVRHDGFNRRDQDLLPLIGRDGDADVG